MTEKQELKFFNTMKRKKEKFVPLVENKCGFYSCGPTVYNYAHIGNLRAYIFADTLKRVLLYNGYEVKHVMNITDVGHLSDDGDDGEDKMQKGAEREKKTVWQIAEFYTESFKKNLKDLNIISPTIYCKATEHIKQQIEMIKLLEQHGFTYNAGGNVYFDTSLYEKYGEMANLNEDTKSRVAKDPNKKNNQDFVLWFTKSKFENQAMKWDSPWGTGYPGWHIECSAMSTEYLGEQFDIHTGGIDHVNVHHTNEIAQAECSTGKRPWVNYWMHNEFLIDQTGKMSKSKGKFLHLDVLIEKGYNPLAYRLFCLNTHYRKQLMFSFDALDNAVNSYNNLVKSVRNLLLEKIQGKEEIQGNDDVSNFENNFLEAVNDDLNIPKAIGILWDLINDNILSSNKKLETLYKFDEVLGLNLKEIKLEESKEIEFEGKKLIVKDDISEEEIELAKKRVKAKIEKDWAKADEIRDKLSEMKIIMEDTKDGFILRK